MTREEACHILGVSPGAAPDQIKRKYRQLMHRLHPDVGPSEEDLHLAWQVNAAYALLKRTWPAGASSLPGLRLPQAYSAAGIPVTVHAEALPGAAPGTPRSTATPIGSGTSSAALRTARGR